MKCLNPQGITVQIILNFFYLNDTISQRAKMLGTPKFLFFSSAVCNGFLEINESKTWQGIFTSQSSSQLTTTMSVPS